MNEHEAPLKIVTWFLLATSGVAVAGRILAKMSTPERLNVDDTFAVLALAFSVGSGAAVSVAAGHGLGAPMESLSLSDIDAMRKSIYAAGIFYILAVACAKVSIVILLRILFVRRSHRAIIHALGGALFIQMLSCTVAALVPCSIPSIWAIGSGHCVDLEAFWRAVGITNIVIDILLIALPCYLVSNINISLENKFTVVSCFAVRVIDIGAIATQLAYTYGFSSSDLSAAVWPWFLIGQVAQTAGIISSSTPYLQKPLLALSTGMFRGEEIVGTASIYTDTRLNSSTTTDRVYTLRTVDSGMDSKMTASQKESISSVGLRGWDGCGFTTSIRRDDASRSLDLPAVASHELGNFAVQTSNSVTVVVSNRDGEVVGKNDS